MGPARSPSLGRWVLGCSWGRGEGKRGAWCTPKSGFFVGVLKCGVGGGWSSGVPQIGFSFVRGLNRGGARPKNRTIPNQLYPQNRPHPTGDPKMGCHPLGTPSHPFFFSFFFCSFSHLSPSPAGGEGFGVRLAPRAFCLRPLRGGIGGGQLFREGRSTLLPAGLRTPLLPPLRPLCPTHPRRGSGGPWGRDGGSWRQRDLFGGSWGVVGPPLGWWETLRWIGTLWGALEAEEPTGGGPWDPVGCRGTSWGAVG